MLWQCWVQRVASGQTDLPHGDKLGSGECYYSRGWKCWWGGDRSISLLVLWVPEVKWGQTWNCLKTKIPNLNALYKLDYSIWPTTGSIFRFLGFEYCCTTQKHVLIRKRACIYKLSPGTFYECVSNGSVFEGDKVLESRQSEFKSGFRAQQCL